MHLFTITAQWDGHKLDLTMLPAAAAVTRLGWPRKSATWHTTCDSEQAPELMNELGCEFARVTAWFFRESDILNRRNRPLTATARREEAGQNAIDAMLTEVENLRIVTDPLF